MGVYVRCLELLHMCGHVLPCVEYRAALSCKVRFMLEQVQIDPPGVVPNVFPDGKDFKFEKFDTAKTLSLQIELTGLCELTLEHIEFSKISPDAPSDIKTTIDSAAVTFDGSVTGNIGAIDMEAQLDDFGVEVQFAGESTTMARVGALSGRIEGSLGQFNQPPFKDLADIIPGTDLKLAVAFQQLGGSEFDYFVDMDLTALVPVIIDIAQELKGFSIGLPEFIPGTRASTMPIPRVFDFSSVLSRMAESVEEYLTAVGPARTTTARRGVAPTAYPTLVGLANSIGGSMGNDFFKLSGNLRVDPAVNSIVLQLELLLNIDFRTQYKGGSSESNAIESMCNSLYAQLTTKHKGLFESAIDTDQLKSGKGCGAVTVEANGVLGATISLDLAGALALNGEKGKAEGEDTLVGGFVENAVLTLHPDTRLEVDLVAQPNIPFIDSDIRVHFLVDVGKQDVALTLKDLLNASMVQRTFRNLEFQQLYGHLDAAFKPKLDALSPLLSAIKYPDALPKLQPVLVLSSRDLFGPGFGLTALVDVGFDFEAPSLSLPNATHPLQADFTQTDNSSIDGVVARVMDGVAGALKSVTGFDVGTAVGDTLASAPRFFEPLGIGGASSKGFQVVDKISSVTSSFIRIWRAIAAYRKGAESSYIKLVALQALRTGVLDALGHLIEEVTGVDPATSSKSNHLLAMAFDMFGMLLPDGKVPSAAAVKKFNPFATVPTNSDSVSVLSQYHLGERANPIRSVKDRIVDLLDRVLPRQLTLRSVLSFCTKHLKAMFSRLSAPNGPAAPLRTRRQCDAACLKETADEEAREAAMVAWEQYHAHLAVGKSVSKDVDAFGGALSAQFGFGMAPFCPAIRFFQPHFLSTWGSCRSQVYSSIHIVKH